MSSVATPDSSAELPVADEHAHEHPGEKTYLKIAVILAVLTALEVATYPAEDALGSAVIPILLVLMVIKFWYVAAFFMHLKFDSRMFSWVFIAGIVTGAACYLAVLATFEFFG
ncbi:cytochrome C oxidase subunit IV family protein [Actinomarinicola tropica]|uniref:Cytochrome C oxidase subunit IV n=1 Tax=Actinomarinicola tropica TaxID=2789776 RepID=A0A5Q2RMN2_9ACTN|nr:cytochrome C oxidase subunit IV family protein [Actinomarinicola tropica]QGG96724.1 cytochrome C oxidase subunit IV [Actinomarinicola tropica]